MKRNKKKERIIEQVIGGNELDFKDLEKEFANSEHLKSLSDEEKLNSMYMRLQNDFLKSVLLHGVSDNLTIKFQCVVFFVLNFCRFSMIHGVHSKEVLKSIIDCLQNEFEHGGDYYLTR